MTRILRDLAATMATALVFILGAPLGAAEASLVGDSVTCSASVIACSVPNVATVTDAGIEFGLLPGAVPVFTVDLKASSITLAFIDFDGENLLPVAPGVTMTLGDLDSSAGDIVGVSLATSGAVTNLALSDISFTAHSVVIDLGGTLWQDTPTPGTAVISLIFENSAAVPVPASFVLLISAVAGMGVVRAWRRR